MALVDNTTWCGENARDFYAAAILTGRTKELMSLVPNVKSKIKIPSLALGDILQAGDCSFADYGTTTLSQKELSVCDIKVNKEFCITDFENNFLSEQLRPGSNDAQVPASFNDFFLGLMSQKISEQTEDLLWNGDTEGSPADICDGLLKQFVADSDVVDVGGTILSASNIITEIGKVYAAIPNTVINKGTVKIFISTAAAKFYRQAIAAANPALISYNNGDFKLSYIDVELIETPALPTNDMVAADPKNLWFGTDLMSDFEDVKIINMYETTGAPNFRFAARFKFGVSYGVGAEIVYYT